MKMSEEEALFDGLTLSSLPPIVLFVRRAKESVGRSELLFHEPMNTQARKDNAASVLRACVRPHVKLCQ